MTDKLSIQHSFFMLHSVEINQDKYANNQKTHHKLFISSIKVHPFKISWENIFNMFKRCDNTHV